MAYLKPRYTGAAKETFDKAFPFENYETNKIYVNDYGKYVYVNSQRFMHVQTIRRVLFDNRFSHYTVEDCLLTNDNMLKHTSDKGFYKTYNDAVRAIENNRCI